MLSTLLKKNFTLFFSKSITLVRHGESIGNAGLPINCTYQQYPLTPKGWKEAEKYSETVQEAPDIIVSSPFKRAIDTSLPLRKLYPKAEFIIDPRLAAFAYLGNEYYTTKRYSRSGAINSYWNALDPDLIAGDGAESFRAFHKRTLSFFHWFEKLNDAKIIGFTHAMSIRMLELYSKHILPDDPYKALVAYKKHRESRRVNNCESFTWKVK